MSVWIRLPPKMCKPFKEQKVFSECSVNADHSIRQ